MQMGNHSMIKGKIVLVPFPFNDLSSVKLRPAACLTNPISPHRHVVLAFITSQTPDDILESDIVLNSSRDDFNTTGLRVSSTIRLHRLMTVSASIIERELGELSPQMQVEVNKKLRKLFEYNSNPKK
ncbi:MAG: type II toxin-antitoxin system PemK/MazF family toxin [bacterium]